MSQARRPRYLAGSASLVLALAACTTTTQPVVPTTPVTPVPSATTAVTPVPTPVSTITAPTTAPTGTPTATETPAATATAATNPSGGTIYLLKNATDFDYYDPQRIYTPEDLAFFGATTMRSLIAYKYSQDPADATTLVPDMATDTGNPNADATSWTFTLRDGLTWQDGSPLKCEDIKYGVSRTFATEAINGGPTYAVAYLNIPSIDGFKKAEDGTISPSTVPAYVGPYVDNIPKLFSDDAATAPVANDKAAFDSAVVCDGPTVRFNLNQSVPDFNYTTTLGFGAVPNPIDHPGVDTVESYVGDKVWSDGPYKITEYIPSEGGRLLLERNDSWNRASDDYRGAYPDRWEVDFGLDFADIDQRLMTSTGNDAYAIDYGGVQPASLPSLFADPHSPLPEFAGRAFSASDPYSRYYWIDTTKVTNLKIRQAMAAALDREALRRIAGGEFFGDFADGVIKPIIGQDYAATGLWTSLLGQPIPNSGDPSYARTLIAQSGEPAPTLTWNYFSSPTADRTAAIVKKSLENAGFKVKLNAFGSCYGNCYSGFDDADFGTGGWGADWPNASTVIPQLFTRDGSWDLSKVDDTSGIPDWTAQVNDARTTLDRAAQALKWQDLNRKAAEQAWIIPTFFTLTQHIAGTEIGGLYRWAAYASWPYAQMYVKSSG